MSRHRYQSCIEACHVCALTCERCAKACLSEANVAAMADCIMLGMDCAAICRLAAEYMGHESKMTHIICKACGEICERCQDECAKYQMDHCKECVEACRQCALQCRSIANLTVGDLYHHSPDANVAGLRQ